MIQVSFKKCLILIIKFIAIIFLIKNFSRYLPVMGSTAVALRANWWSRSWTRRTRKEIKRWYETSRTPWHLTQDWRHVRREMPAPPERIWDWSRRRDEGEEEIWRGGWDRRRKGAELCNFRIHPTSEGQEISKANRVGGRSAMRLLGIPLTRWRFPNGNIVLYQCNYNNILYRWYNISLIYNYNLNL